MGSWLMELVRLLEAVAWSHGNYGMDAGMRGLLGTQYGSHLAEKGRARATSSRNRKASGEPEEGWAA